MTYLAVKLLRRTTSSKSIETERLELKVEEPNSIIIGSVLEFRGHDYTIIHLQRGKITVERELIQKNSPKSLDFPLEQLG
jgi:hypothetical protein